MTTQALELATRAGAETWLDDSNEPHLSIPVENHVEHSRLTAIPDSPGGRWLSRLFYEEFQRALPTTSKKEVLENLIAEAFFAGRRFPSGRRVARVGDHAYLDLCSPGWEVVDVSPEGWAVRSSADVPIRFTRGMHMLALPIPIPGGRISDLRPFFNCQDDDFRLIVAWILAALSGGREYPVLVFGGEAGSAKSTATRFARAMVDPNAAPLRKTPKEERDLFIAAKNAFTLTFDNLSSPPNWLPDALCALALDTGYACRALYTNDEEAIFRVASPIILNGISEQLTRSDLADRALSVTLHRVTQERMRPKDELDAEFNAAQPAILGAFLDVLSNALRRLPEIRLDRLPRLAQTAKLMAAAEPALGWVNGAFTKLFEKSQESVASNVLESDPVAQALFELVRRAGGRWSFKGSATELRAVVGGVKPQPLPPAWPFAANKLSEKLRRIAPTLRHLGWDGKPDGRDGTAKNSRVIRIDYPIHGIPHTCIEKEAELSESSERPKQNPDDASTTVGPVEGTAPGCPKRPEISTPGNSETIDEPVPFGAEVLCSRSSGQSDDLNELNLTFPFAGEIE